MKVTDPVDAEEKYARVIGTFNTFTVVNVQYNTHCQPPMVISTAEYTVFGNKTEFGMDKSCLTCQMV